MNRYEKKSYANVNLRVSNRIPNKAFKESSTIKYARIKKTILISNKRSFHVALRTKADT